MGSADDPYMVLFVSNTPPWIASRLWTCSDQIVVIQVKTCFDFFINISNTVRWWGLDVA